MFSEAMDIRRLNHHPLGTSENSHFFCVDPFLPNDVIAMASNLVFTCGITPA